jgi:hypothetical protein
VKRPAALGPRELEERAREQLRQKLDRGEKLTAADYDFLRQWNEDERRREADERRAAEAKAAAKKAAKSRGRKGGGDDAETVRANGGATLEEDLEEWTLRDGVVRGRVMSISGLRRSHQVTEREMDLAIHRVQRGLLRRYAFESTKKSGELTGAEALALSWVKSIGQIGRASQQWELQLEAVKKFREDDDAPLPMEMFSELMQTLRILVEKRDSLSLKVRELGVKEKRAGTGRGQKANSFTIVMSDE